MIIDKVLPYWTDEDRQRLAEIQRQQDALLEELEADQPETQEELQHKWSKVDEWSKLGEQTNQIRREVENRYIKSHTKKAILADVEEIVNAVEKEDFLASVEDMLSKLATLKANGARDENIALLSQYAVKNYENCYNFILHLLRVQLNAIKNDDEESLSKVRSIIDKRVSLWYVKPRPAFVPMAHGKATYAFAYMSTRYAEIDRITGNATIEKFGVQLVISKLKELQTTLGISTDKLLCTAMAGFTQQNDFKHNKDKEPKREVRIPLKEYAKDLRYDVEEHETNTPEEAEREKKRAKIQLDNARRAIKKDLDIIQATTLTWQEKIGKRNGDYRKVNIVEDTGIQNGYIIITFGPKMAKYIVERNLITQYPRGLLGLDNRNPNAYYIGRKLAEHYNQDSNQIRGTHDRISIPALLAVTDLPSYKEVQQKDRGHWQERIKDRLENALDTLTQEAILSGWEYTHAKAVALTDEEAYNITSYEEYAKLYIHFTLADEVDHAERIKAKQEAREKAIKRKRTRKKKS